MEKQFDYVTKLDIKYEHLQRMDIPQMVKECTDKWFNQTLTQVNESVVRLGIVEGEYHWHKHDNDDEFFFVLEGQLLIDLEGQTIELNPKSRCNDFKGRNAQATRTQTDSDVNGRNKRNPTDRRLTKRLRIHGTVHLFLFSMAHPC